MVRTTLGWGAGLRTAVAILVAFALHAQAAEGSIQNDAGSGIDAAADMQSALKLKREGTFYGNLTAGDSEDWYRLKVPGRTQPTCVSASATASGTMGLRVSGVNAQEAREVVARIGTETSGFAGIATDGLNGALVDAHNDGGLTTYSGRSYRFDLTTRDLAGLGPGDGGSGDDAGGDEASALPVTSACIGGTIEAGAGDTDDVYVFAGRAGQRVLFSLSDTASTLQLTLGSGDETLAQTLNGSLTGLTLPATQNYYLTVSAPTSMGATSTSAASSYILGVCTLDCKPPERPCEPMCIELMSAD